MLKPRTLEQMQLYGTTYEIVAKHDNGQEMRLAFTGRKTKRMLFDVACRNADALTEMGAPGETDGSYTKDWGWRWGPVRVCFSGRTERDCASLAA